MCGRKDKTTSPHWSVLRLGGQSQSGIGQQVQECRWKGMQDGKGEETSSEMPEIGWLALRECVRAQCRWNSAMLVLFFFFLLFAGCGRSDRGALL